MKKLILFIVLIIIGGYLFLYGCPEMSMLQRAGDDQTEQTEQAEQTEQTEESSSPSDIGLYDVDGGGWNYAFTYNGEQFRAVYSYDCWTIYDSYKITKKRDMKKICQALIDVHPIHGKDFVSYRTADDMAYEWQQHNLAYKYLPEDNAWRQHAANVDLDPYDQGRSIEEIYEDRTGQEIDLKEKLKDKVREKIDDGTLLETMKEYLFH